MSVCLFNSVLSWSWIPNLSLPCACVCVCFLKKQRLLGSQIYILCLFSICWVALAGSTTVQQNKKLKKIGILCLSIKIILINKKNLNNVQHQKKKEGMNRCVGPNSNIHYYRMYQLYIFCVWIGLTWKNKKKLWIGLTRKWSPPPQKKRIATGPWPKF